MSPLITHGTCIPVQTVRSEGGGGQSVDERSLARATLLKQSGTGWNKRDLQRWVQLRRRYHVITLKNNDGDVNERKRDRQRSPRSASRSNKLKMRYCGKLWELVKFLHLHPTPHPHLGKPPFWIHKHYLFFFFHEYEKDEFMGSGNNCYQLNALSHNPSFSPYKCRHNEGMLVS